MNIVDPFMWVMAFLPIITLIVLMVVFRWGASKAAPVGLIITIFTGLIFYKANIPLLAIESAKGVWNALVIILIIWTAILMYQVGDSAKAFLAIRSGMNRLLPNELLLVMAMGWVFESFLQGITGFGVPVAVGAPLLIGIGVKPLWAVVIPLLGQAWGNTFGTLAAAWDSLALSAGLVTGSAEYFKTALWTSAFIFLWNCLAGFAICWFYGRWKAVSKGFYALVVISLIQGGGEILLSQINTTLCCFIPALVSLVVLILMGQMKRYKEAWKIEDSKIMDRTVTASSEQNEIPMTLMQAFVPYFLLSIITIAVLTIEPLNKFLGQWSWGPSFPETSTGLGYVNSAVKNYSPLAPLTHASMFLFVSAIIGLIYYQAHGWIKKGAVSSIFSKSTKMTMPSGIAVVTLVIMSRIMGGTMQTTVLANGIAATLGKSYTILAPFVGLLGTFMTGSNMSSNILFGDFQMATAKILNLDAPAILGAQSAGGAIGSALSPSKIILGTTTANILGKEGDVMRQLMLITIPATIVIGLILYVAIVIL